MMQYFPLMRGLQAIADANGNATITFQPAIANEDWHVTHHEVNNPGPNIPTVIVYKNVIAPSGFVDQTINGLFGNSDTIVDLISSETLIYVWSRCTIGSVCNVTIRGQRMVNM